MADGCVFVSKEELLGLVAVSDAASVFCAGGEGGDEACSGATCSARRVSSSALTFAARLWNWRGGRRGFELGFGGSLVAVSDAAPVFCADGEGGDEA